MPRPMNPGAIRRHFLVGPKCTSQWGRRGRRGRRSDRVGFALARGATRAPRARRRMALARPTMRPRAAASAAAERRRAEEVSRGERGEARLERRRRRGGRRRRAALADAKARAVVVLARAARGALPRWRRASHLFVGPRPAHIPPTVWAFDFEELSRPASTSCDDGASDPGTRGARRALRLHSLRDRHVAARCAPNDHASARAWFSGLVCSRLACRCGADLGWTYHVPADARCGAAAASKASPKEDEARPACAAKDSGEAPVSSIHPWRRSAESKVDEAKIDGRAARAELEQRSARASPHSSRARSARRPSRRAI